MRTCVLSSSRVHWDLTEGFQNKSAHSWITLIGTLKIRIDNILECTSSLHEISEMCILTVLATTNACNAGTNITTIPSMRSIWPMFVLKDKPMQKSLVIVEMTTLKLIFERVWKWTCVMQLYSGHFASIMQSLTVNSKLNSSKHTGKQLQLHPPQLVKLQVHYCCLLLFVKLPCCKLRLQALPRWAFKQ